MSFEQVRSKFNLTATDFFRYLHIQSFIRTHIHTYADIPCHEALEGILKVEPGSRGAVSILYQTLMRQEVVSTEKQQAELEAEIGVPVTEEVWETCLENIHRCSGNARLNLIQFKVIHRLHYSKVKVNKMYPSVSELCNKCNSQPGTLTHQFWSCPNLHSYWSSIFDFYSKAFNTSWDPDPLVAILGTTDNETLSHGRDKWAVYMGMVLARKLILRLWKSDAVPSFEMWLRELGETLHLEKVKFRNAGRMDTFHKAWGAVLSHLEELSRGGDVG